VKYFIVKLDVRGPPGPYIYLRGSSGPRRIWPTILAPLPARSRMRSGRGWRRGEGRTEDEGKEQDNWYSKSLMLSLADIFVVACPCLGGSDTEAKKKLST
jgi:hypothetical protein